MNGNSDEYEKTEHLRREIIKEGNGQCENKERGEVSNITNKITIVIRTFIYL